MGPWEAELTQPVSAIFQLDGILTLYITDVNHFPLHSVIYEVHSNNRSLCRCSNENLESMLYDSLSAYLELLIVSGIMTTLDELN